MIPMNIQEMNPKTVEMFVNYVKTTEEELETFK